MTLPGSLSREEVREYDARAIAAGIPGSVLMENAARGATELLLSLGVVGRVSIVCGKGNNAGDGFVMARHLHGVGKSVIVELLSDPANLQGDALTAFRPLEESGITIQRIDPEGCERIAPGYLNAFLNATPMFGMDRGRTFGDGDSGKHSFSVRSGDPDHEFRGSANLCRRFAFWFGCGHRKNTWSDD